MVRHTLRSRQQCTTHPFALLGGSAACTYMWAKQVACGQLAFPRAQVHLGAHRWMCKSKQATEVPHWQLEASCQCEFRPHVVAWRLATGRGACRDLFPTTSSASTQCS